MTNKQMEQMMFDLKKSIIEELRYIWLQDVIDSVMELFEKELKDELDELKGHLTKVSKHIGEKLDGSE